MLVDLCSLASLLEESTSCQNGQKYCTLSQMYKTTRKLHLRAWSAFEDLWFGPSPPRYQESGADKMAQLLVCNSYCHFIHTIYRSFLIAEPALRSSGQTERAASIWLRHTCRYATDATEDSITLTHEIFKASNTKAMRRYNAFFLETSCAILLYASMGHPSKYPHHRDRLGLAIECLELMVDDDPITNSILHVKKLIDAVKGYIYGPPSLGMEDPSSNAAADHHRNPDQARERFGLSPLDHVMDMPTSSISGGEDYMVSSFLDLLPLDPSFLLMAEDGTDMVE